MDGKSLDITEAKRNRLKEILPEAFTEGKINWEKLKATLGDDIEFKNERYVLNWAGKSDAFRVLQSPTTATLVPCEEESVEFDDTENIFIDGENLEVLKVLQKSYFGKIKMIYIDPPYNTGNDEFIYPDKFSETKEEYLSRIGDKDETGYMTREGLFRTNSKDNGHYHSNWLSMMYPRLFLARNLLREDGVIFVSIDDNEVHNLRLLMNEVFGEENFLGCAARITKKSNNKGDFWSPNFDYILTYGKDLSNTTRFFGGVNYDAYDQVETEGSRKGEKYQLVRLYMSTIENRNPEQRFYIECPDGSKVIPPGSTFPPDRPVLGDGIWRWTKNKFDELREYIVIKKVRSSNLIDEHGKPAKWNVYTKTYLKEVIKNASAKPNSLVESHINQIGSHELGDLKIPFDYSKPSTLIKYLIEISRIDKNDIILDFFAGSATTAHAVLDLNKEDGGNRKFIMIQLPEKTDEKKEAFKAGYETIADIGKERIRRVIGKIKAEQQSKLDVDGTAGKQDLGFKVFKLQQSNFKIWRSDVKNEEELVTQLTLHTDPVDENATIENILYELLLKSGVPLTANIEERVGCYLVNGGEIALILKKIDGSIIEAAISEQTQKVITLDRLFENNDQLKTNTALQMKDAEIDFRVV